ncbi:hypothetical protein FIBSPDRAFT_787379 [Athelia psychrophila]|uniref:AAA+ ATPase domain-containing protein n=1 Tax=Athelia psychrophila TaxID=1759441 RepID=A0A166KSC5_9AGAM|nr:hypothetical protein FIBSPDRAFT_787379 [Fibularhizoctonia sp. CBS 109695]
MRQRTTSTKLTHRSAAFAARQRKESVPINWLFRSNIPRRRNQSFGSNIQRRNFFGMGEIIGVLTNPAETVRSLTESKQLLDEARREIRENKERAQIRTKHTFSRLPGFMPRPAEIQAIERALEGEPSFTILFGASSVGKTALLREVLTREQYHVLHFDLRIPGFADLASLYTSLSTQMEQYFAEIARQMDGYKEFEQEGWSFKHDRIAVEKRLAEGGKARTSDIARLMELFQSSLLKYWEFDPHRDDVAAAAADTGSRRSEEHAPSEREREQERRHSSESSDTTRVDDHDAPPPKPRRKWGFRRKDKAPAADAGAGAEKEAPKPRKKMPVIFFDEAHKLPALIQTNEAMKCLLDSMLVLTKQDRLCHVIHATSDPFYQTWLRQLNVMQHCKIITIGDCTRAETQVYYRDRVLKRVPERLQRHLNFDDLWDAFGGKLAHWHDYITDYINSGGRLDVKHSSHFLQAHALLNLHIIHSSQSAHATSPPLPHQDPSDPIRRPDSSTDAIHPGLGPAGFRIYSPLTGTPGAFSGADPNNSNNNGYSNGYNGYNNNGSDRATEMTAGCYAADFSAMQLLKVMSRLSQPGIRALPYFPLCREMGVRAVDGMVKGRVLDLRWTELVRAAEEDDWVTIGASARSAMQSGAVGTGTEEGHMSAVSEHAPVTPITPAGDEDEDEEEEIVGPRLVPCTPIMYAAMREVVMEYEDAQSVSEYASLSEVDEY